MEDLPYRPNRTLCLDIMLSVTLQPAEVKGHATAKEGTLTHCIQWDYVHNIQGKH